MSEYGNLEKTMEEIQDECYGTRFILGFDSPTLNECARELTVCMAPCDGNWEVDEVGLLNGMIYKDYILDWRCTTCKYLSQITKERLHL